MGSSLMSLRWQTIVATGALLGVAALGVTASRLPRSNAASLPLSGHHYAPLENLEAIDLAQLANATRSIDMAAYTLTDVAVINALAEAGRRGLHVRIILDQSTVKPRGYVVAARAALAATPNVEERVKSEGPLMHLKAYAIDGLLLRTGSANFSASGLKRQNNELMLDLDHAAVSRFESEFSSLWSAGQTIASGPTN